MLDKPTRTVKNILFTCIKNWNSLNGKEEIPQVNIYHKNLAVSYIKITVWRRNRKNETLKNLVCCQFRHHRSDGAARRPNPKSKARDRATASIKKGAAR